MPTSEEAHLIDEWKYKLEGFGGPVKPAPNHLRCGVEKEAKHLMKSAWHENKIKKLEVSNMQRLVQRGLCPECGSPMLVADTEMGETVCSKCGLVILGDMLDRSPEWRAFTSEEKRSKSRVGAPVIYSHFDKGLSTVIWGNRDAFGRLLSAEVRHQMRRLRKWQIRSRVHSSVNRNLAHAMSELDRLSDKASISSPVKERAAVIYRKALDKGLVRGRSIAAIAAAALYASCRITRTPRTLREITDASLVDRKDVARCYRLLLREFDIRMPFAVPLDYVSKIAEKTGISGETQGLALRILREAKRKRITIGKDPTGFAATVLYIACQLKGEKMTQKEVAAAANVTEVTIRNRKKELMKKLNLEGFKMGEIVYLDQMKSDS